MRSESEREADLMRAAALIELNDNRREQIARGRRRAIEGERTAAAKAKAKARVTLLHNE